MAKEIGTIRSGVMKVEKQVLNVGLHKEKEKLVVRLSENVKSTNAVLPFKL